MTLVVPIWPELGEDGDGEEVDNDGEDVVVGLTDELWEEDTGGAG